jgi:hypothetical protein
MPIKVKDVLAKLPHVTIVAPVVTQITTAGALEIIAGIDLPSYESLSGGFHYLQGGPFQGPYDALVDDLFAQSKHARVGDTIEILSNNFRISGIVERGKGARKFVPISTLQDLTGAKDKASIMYGNQCESQQSNGSGKTSRCRSGWRLRTGSAHAVYSSTSSSASTTRSITRPRIENSSF